MAQDPLEPTGALRERIATYGLEFLARFLTAATARQPAAVEALIDLAQVLTQLGRYGEGLAVDRQLVELLPEEPTVHYNLACSLALTGAREESLAALERSVDLGYDDAEVLSQDEDLASLRTEPRFLALVERLSGGSAP
jgi:Flp pilus assembly protein TadD